MLHPILAVSLMLVCAVVSAQQAGSAVYTKPDLSVLDEEAAKKFSPEAVTRQIEQYKEKAKQITQGSDEIRVSAMSGKDGGPGGNNVEQFAAHISESLGIPEADGQLLVFVSHSMPDALLRAYLLEGSWAGARLVIRGIPVGMSMQDYLLDKMGELVQGRAGASFTIDPRPFDLYSIRSVPTIVWQPGPLADCRVNGTEDRMDGLGKPQAVQACAPAGVKHWKMSGAVTLDYALEQFEKRGSEGAGRRLDVLRENVAPEGNGKSQAPFEGDWKTAKFPGEGFNPPVPSPNQGHLEYGKGVLSVPLPVSTPDTFEQ